MSFQPPRWMGDKSKLEQVINSDKTLILWHNFEYYKEFTWAQVFNPSGVRPTQLINYCPVAVPKLEIGAALEPDNY